MPGSRILIVDDEAPIRVMLTRMIEPLGHEVKTAEDGQEAYELVRREPFDLIVSDLNMPRMDGLTLLERIRTNGNDAAFIILTGYGDLPQALAARERFNIANFLVKPIHNLDQFLFDIESAISRRRLEQENDALMASLQQVNQELEEKVHHRTRELEESNQELRRLSSFRADVLKVLGHELRTPLAILTGYVHLIGAEGSDTGAMLGHIRSSTDRLREIVEKALLQLKRSGETGFSLELAPVEVTGLCRSVIERIEPFLHPRGIRIVFNPPGDPPPCVWDREKVEVVLEELLINAVRASEDGAEVRVEVHPRGDDQVELRVKDAGTGIPQGELERVFEPFVTLGAATQHTSGLFDRGAQGIGLGLSTARMWAELHVGRLFAETNGASPGTTLRLVLPVDVPAAQARAGTRAAG